MIKDGVTRRLGCYVYHRTGSYMGQANRLTEHLVYFEGPVTQAGVPVTSAHYNEVMPGPEPVWEDSDDED